ncbi:hypothetical protein D7Y23_02905 [Corallococcus sp. AB050B]|nr:hypothetical protein D7Y23_02905 [Corallococcus sp. AB050B]
MEASMNLRKVYLFVSLIACIYLGVVVGGQLFFGDVELYVIVPEGRTLELSVDGEVRVAKLSASTQFRLKQGDHVVAMKDEKSGKVRTYTLKLTNGLNAYVLPIDERQCFVRLDVTDQWYGPGGRKGTASIRVEHIGSQEPISKEDRDYFNKAALPGSIKRNNRVSLLKAIDCDAMNQDKDTLLAGLEL